LPYFLVLQQVHVLQYFQFENIAILENNTFYVWYTPNREDVV